MTATDDPHRPRSTDPLVDAAWAGSVAAVAERLAAGDDPNTRDDRGTTPLGAATRRCHHAVMEVLLAAGADPNLTDSQGPSLLTMAVSFDPVSARLLLAAGARLSEPRDGEGWSDLMRAASAGEFQADANLPNRVELVRLLIDAGADVNFRGSGGGTPLSATRGEDALVRILLEAGATIPPDRPGDDPLLVEAMWYGLGERPSCEAGICRLIAAGADVHSCDKDGITPLKRACDRGSHRVVAALLEAGAKRVGATLSPDSRPYHDDECLPELHLAARWGNPAVVRLLLEDGADVAERDGTARPALYWAAEAGRTEVVRVLLAAGADPNAPSERGLNPLRVAACGGHVGCVDLLLNAGAEVDAATTGGVTALHLAALWHHKATLARLLEAGADPNRADSAGRTAISRASGNWGQVTQMRRRHSGQVIEIARLLLDWGNDQARWAQLGEAMLREAVRSDRPDIVRRLLQFGIDPNSINDEGLTPLHEAVFQPRVVAALLRGGADLRLLRPIKGSTLARLVQKSLQRDSHRSRVLDMEENHRPRLQALMGAAATSPEAAASGMVPLLLVDADLDSALAANTQAIPLRCYYSRHKDLFLVKILCAVLREQRKNVGAAGRRERRTMRRDFLSAVRTSRDRPSPQSPQRSTNC